jgi:hypothetical protein
MVRAMLRLARARVVYGESIDLSAWYGRRINTALINEVTDRLMAELTELGKPGTGTLPLSGGKASVRFTSAAG